MRQKKELNIKIGKKIKAARESAGLTQEKFAEMINLGTKNISAIERGAVGISIETAIKICTSLSISSDTLFFDGVEENSEVQFLTDRLKHLPPEKLKIVTNVINSLFEAFSLSLKYNFDEKTVENESSQIEKCSSGAVWDT